MVLIFAFEASFGMGNFFGGSKRKKETVLSPRNNNKDGSGSGLKQQTHMEVALRCLRDGLAEVVEKKVTS